MNYSVKAHHCSLCETCLVCHKCLQSKATIFRANSSDSEEEIRVMCESSAENHYKDNHPLYILVGPNNEKIETTPTGRTLSITTKQELDDSSDESIADDNHVNRFDDDGSSESNVDGDLENQIDESSEEDEPISLDCNVCNKTFSNKRDLEIHLIYHSTEEIHKCKVCGMLFEYSYELIKHSLNHKNPNNICEFCKKEFRSAERLRVHTASHTGEFPFSCVVCDKGFKDYPRLKSHLLCHTEDKPFVCDKCGKGFRRKSQLRTHSWVHSEVKPFSCEFCEKPFNYKCNLRLHVQRTHNVFDE